jgi:hypothetical protein
MGCSGQLQVAIRVVPKVYWDFQSLNYCKEIRGSGIGLTNTQRRADGCEPYSTATRRSLGLRARRQWRGREGW